MTVAFRVDDRQAEDEFDRLTNMGGAKAALEKILALQYAAGQAAVHVITGSLRASQEIGSTYTAGRWTGQVGFGGDSGGFENDPVRYAVYEAARGGSHDFTIPITRLTGRYRAAVRAHLRGR